MLILQHVIRQYDLMLQPLHLLPDMLFEYSPRLPRKLQVELTEAKEDNKKLAHQIEDKVNIMRKSGM